MMNYSTVHTGYIVIIVFITQCVFVHSNIYCRDEWQPSQMFNPHTEPKQCGRYDTQSSWICDPCNILSNETGKV